MQNTMKVAYPMRIDAIDKHGGDVELIRIYIRCCQQAALRQGVAFEGEILTSMNPDLSRFDLVHLTNTDRPIDLYAQFLAAKKAGKPMLITPLHHSYREIERYEHEGRGGLVGLVSGSLSFDILESLRTLIKSSKYQELRAASWKALRRGIRQAQVEVLQGCRYVLVAADKEEADINSEIVQLSSKQVVKVRNGFEMPNSPPAQFKDRDIDIAVVARVESRKNQIAILQAVESLGLKAVFVGAPNPNHSGYVQRFRQRIASSKSTYVPGVPPQEVAPILARAKVHVAASWFEVSSQVDVSAYMHGCRVVASRCGGTSELLGEDAYYVDPGSPSDIAEKIALAVRDASDGKKNMVEIVSNRLETWNHIAERLLDLYVRTIESVTPDNGHL